MVDAEFRSQLFSNPEAALSGYDLTEEERASLSALEEDAFDAFAAEVEERISKGVEPSPFLPGLEFIRPNDVTRLLGADVQMEHLGIY